MARSIHGRIATWRVVFALVLIIATSEFACSQEKFKAPKIWDSQKLAGWGIPLAHQGIHENFITEERYYSSPSDNVRTYPVYHPLKEPAGYWEWLNQLDPEPLVSKGEARTEDEWIRIGQDVFDGLDLVQFRTDDPEAIAFLRDPKKFVEEEVVVDADFTIPNFRWVVEEKGKIRISLADCTVCHMRVMPGGSRLRGTPPTDEKFSDVIMAAMDRAFLERAYGGPREKLSLPQINYMEFGVPWLRNDIHQRFLSMTQKEMDLVFQSGVPGTSSRADGSPYFITRIPDLRGVKHSRFLDATATHLNREPADIARYAAHVMYAAELSFGDYHMKKEETRHPLYHYDDDVLFALAMYIYSLEPAANPERDALNPTQVARGREIFDSEACARCHAPPNYGGKMILPVDGFSVPDDHPHQEFINDEGIDTNPDAAMKTRKGTGFYKVPSLRGLWYRKLFGHSGSCATLEDWFNPARLRDDYVPTGWKGPGVEKRSVPGHEFGLDLSPDDKQALFAFLRTL